MCRFGGPIRGIVRFDTCRAPDDLYQPAQLRSLLKDLRDVRQAKIRIGLQSEGIMQGTYLQVNPIRLPMFGTSAHSTDERTDALGAHGAEAIPRQSDGGPPKS
jgi:hypothetical protein